MDLKKQQLELTQQLKDQCDFLNNSGEQYDLGNINEGKRIATQIRILVHNTSDSCSLLKQLKEILGIEIKIFSHREKPLKDCVFYSGLTIQLTKDGIRHVPMLDLSHPRQTEVSVEDWWNTILLMINEEEYTRKEIILGLANKDGGAHVDPDIGTRYHKLTRDIKIFETQGSVNMGKFELAVARESGFYLLYAIKKYFKKELA